MSIRRFRSPNAARSQHPFSSRHCSRSPTHRLPALRCHRRMLPPGLEPHAPLPPNFTLVLAVTVCAIAAEFRQKDQASSPRTNRSHGRASECWRTEQGQEWATVLAQVKARVVLTKGLPVTVNVFGLALLPPRDLIRFNKHKRALRNREHIAMR